MSLRVHLGLSVAGALRNWRTEDWVGCCRDTDSGRILSPDEVKLELHKLLGRGVEMIPTCKAEECPDFDPKTGCPGHEVPESKP